VIFLVHHNVPKQGSDPTFGSVATGLSLRTPRCHCSRKACSSCRLQRSSWGRDADGIGLPPTASLGQGCRRRARECRQTVHFYQDSRQVGRYHPCCKRIRKSSRLRELLTRTSGMAAQQAQQVAVQIETRLAQQVGSVARAISSTSRQPSAVAGETENCSADAGGPEFGPGSLTRSTTCLRLCRRTPAFARWSKLTSRLWLAR
jgi:hypothetical protein